MGTYKDDSIDWEYGILIPNCRIKGPLFTSVVVWMSDVANCRCKRANTCLLYSFNHNRLWKEKKNSSRRGHRIGTTITFYSYFRNSLPNPPSYSYPGFIHIPDEDRHRTSKLLSSPGTEHNDLVMSSNLESRQGPFLESPGNFNNGPQGFFLVWKFKE